MKRFSDLPIYFIFGGLILNFIMFVYNEVSFTNLMIRSSIITILFAGVGYFLASALRGADLALAETAKKDADTEVEGENSGSTIDIRVNSEDDDDLFRLIPLSERDEFAEIDINNFKKLMDQD
jgi:hypothetical protein